MFEDGCLFINACKALRFATILFYFSTVYTKGLVQNFLRYESASSFVNGLCKALAKMARHFLPFDLN